MKRTYWCDTCGEAMGHLDYNPGVRHETERQCIRAQKGAIDRLSHDVEMLREEVQRRA